MCSEGVSVWFACKLCKCFFLNAHDFAYHKKKSHVQEFQNTKFIVFEEQTTPAAAPPENWVSFLPPMEETRVHKIVSSLSTSTRSNTNEKFSEIDPESNKHLSDHGDSHSGSDNLTSYFISNSDLLVANPTTPVNFNHCNLVEVVKTEFETGVNQIEENEFLDEGHDGHDPFESESSDESLAEESFKGADSSSNNLNQSSILQTPGLYCNDAVDPFVTGVKMKTSDLMTKTNDVENPTRLIPGNSLQESQKRILELETKMETVKGNVNKYKSRAKRLKLELQEVIEQHNDDVEVDIGFGVSVRKGLIERIKVDSPSATIFARSLFRAVFSKDELKDRSLFGRACNANKDVQVKPAVDESKRNAVIAYTLDFFKPDETLSIARQKEVKSTTLGRINKTLGDYVREVNSEKTTRID